jgi:hypothetical protein
VQEHSQKIDKIDLQLDMIKEALPSLLAAELKINAFALELQDMPHTDPRQEELLHLKREALTEDLDYVLSLLQNTSKYIEVTAERF